MQVDTSTLPVGVSQFVVAVSGTDRSGGAVRYPVDRETIEMRDPAGSRQEVALRSAIRWLLRGDTGEAERSMRAVLETYPASSIGHRMLGVILEQQGRDAEAAVSFERAMALLESRADLELLKFHPDPAAILEGLKARLEAIRARRR